MRRRCASAQYRWASRKPDTGSPSMDTCWRPYTPPTDTSSNGAVRWLSQSPFPGSASWARNTTTSPRASTIARFQLLGPAGSATSTKRARGNWLTICRVPSVEPESAQTISSGVRPWPMIRCRTVPKARPALRVGITIEIESGAPPISDVTKISLPRLREVPGSRFPPPACGGGRVAAISSGSIGAMHAVPGLACPACRGDLRADGEATLTCESCGARYPILAGIPSFVPAEAGPRPSRYQLTVLIPASNQTRNLDRLLPALRQELRSLEISHELLVVDQGSTDGTEETAGRHDARLLRPAMPGYGGALRTGFDQALGEYILTLDADGSHDPSFLAAIWTARAGVEVVIASRYVDGGGAEMPRARQALSRTLSAVLRRGLTLPYSDLSSGYRLYRRAALDAITLPAP